MRLSIAAALVAAVPLFAQTPAASDTITVTATRTESRVADTPASVVVLSRDVLATTAASATDDALRQVAGFTLFRRTGSRVANPTSQGVSLRGIGASGASRALVLDDGIPLNDPFGGWVYWGRVPRVSLDRVEVLRGGASDLYGSSAMGGVVQFIRRADNGVAVDASAGSERTVTTSFFAARRTDAWHASVSGDLFTTNGYVLVAPSQRGLVDVAADSHHTALDATGGIGATFVRASLYRETRNNGTPLQVNDTDIKQLAAGTDASLAGGMLTLRAFGSDQDYHQTFSAIAANRATERLTVDQRVPSRGTGGSAQWTRALGSHNALVTGAELRQVSGTSDEGRTVVTGRQRTSSAYIEDILAATPALSVTAGLRFDGWRNDTSWSPRLSVLWKQNDALTWTASAYRAFRAPTLNELYRSFRVGNVLTQANESLGPERLSAIELGARGRSLRATLFWMQTDDAIANATLSVTPSLITRQRQNIGASTSRGLELEGDWRLGSSFRVSAGYLFADATVQDGKRVPQVPRHQLTSQLMYVARVTAGVQARWTSMQFDDDLNQLPLRSALVVDLFASHPLVRRLEGTLALENALDRRVEASATPVITLAQPRSWRVGVRWRG